MHSFPTVNLWKPNSQVLFLCKQHAKPGKVVDSLVQAFLLWSILLCSKSRTNASWKQGLVYRSRNRCVCCVSYLWMHTNLLSQLPWQLGGLTWLGIDQCNVSGNDMCPYWPDPSDIQWAFLPAPQRHWKLQIKMSEPKEEEIWVLKFLLEWGIHSSAMATVNFMWGRNKLCHVWAITHCWVCLFHVLELPQQIYLSWHEPIVPRALPSA